MMNAMQERRLASEAIGPEASLSMVKQYEQVVADAVEVVLSEALSETAAPRHVEERVSSVWRDLLTIVAAEELSYRLAHAAAQGKTLSMTPGMLRRALEPYTHLVTAAAEAETARDRNASNAAD